jgi:hypothetical protein
MRLKLHSLRLVGFTSAALVATTALLAGCSDDSSVGNNGAGATGSGTGAGTGTGAGAGAGTGAGAAGGTTGSGGATGSGGSVTGAGGAGNAGGSVGTGGNPAGGTGNAGGASGGAGGAGGSSGGTGPIDTKPNAKPGDMTNVPQDYLRLGEIRILNNNWGSEDLQSASPPCTAADSSMSIFVNQDKRFGWTFDRGDCDKNNTNAKPDFPQIEFGIHPFGIGSALATSPHFSSTTLLPKKISQITTASVTVENLEIQLQAEANWNITFEFWISQNDPLQANAGVYAELMTFWGWENDRWPSGGPGMNGSCDGGMGCGQTVSTGGKTYTLWVQRDNWGDGWRYFQFRDNAGPNKTFNGKIDVKPLLDYLVNTRGYSSEYYVTRLEVGSEIDDNTKGTVSMSNITFEVNGETRSAEFGQ